MAVGADTVTSIYTARVNAVMDHVRANLDRDLSLAELARVAHFSPFHFHRIFKGVTGETLAQFTRRARLERAVRLMRAAPARELGSIGVEVGFATPSEFSRVFRSVYGRSPSSWDRWSRLDAAPSSTAGVDASTVPDRAPPNRPGGAIRVVERPPLRAVYVRVRDPWRHDHLERGYERLVSWLHDRGVDHRPRQLVGLSWESDKATPLDRLSYDLAIAVPDHLTAEGEVGVHDLPGARAVEMHCIGLPATGAAWEQLYGQWLPSSGFEPADRPAMKWFRRTPDRLDRAAWDVDCSVALRPLAGGR